MGLLKIKFTIILPDDNRFMHEIVSKQRNEDGSGLMRS
jgi:hypothetical protein